jgi:type I restriction enzyme, S subunit
MNTYSEYKNSGIDWIGKIPNGWKCARLKYLFDSSKGKKPNKLFNENKKGFVPYLSMSYLRNNENIVESYCDPEDKILVAKKGDILLLWDGSNAGEFVISKEGVVSSTMAKLNLIQNQNDSYYFYTLKVFERKLRELTIGMGIPHVSSFDLNYANLPLPSLPEQKAIASFLDGKTLKINEFIKKKQQLIELLKEQRIGIINHTITKGLNKKIGLKNSNITWIGKIPKHWTIKKLKYNTYIKGRIGWQALKTDEFVAEGPYCVTGTDFKEGVISWNTCYHVGEERWTMDHFIQLKEKDLLITKDGTIGKIAIVKNLNGNACLNSGVFVTRPKNDDYITEYMYWVLNSTIFTEFINFEKKGTTISHLYQNVFENMPYTQPLIFEQKEIVKFLDQETSQIDKSVEKIQKEIELLKEYKDALISEAVTGKIKVTHE